jgi:hypothetical protein
VCARLAFFFRLSVRELSVLLLLFALSLPAVTLRLYASDEVQYYSYLRSLWFDRDVSFDNEYRHFFDAGVARSTLFSKTFIEPVTDTGLRRNFATVGSAILWSPFFAAVDVSVRVARVFGSDIPADGYARPYVAAVCFGSAIYGFLTVLFSIRIARSLTGSGLRAAIVVWLGTPLLFYMYVAPVFGHATSAFAVTLFVVAWLRARREWDTPNVVLLAAAGALMAMVREQDAFFIVGPAVDFAVTQIRSRQWLSVNTLGGAAVGAATFIVCFAPQLLAYQALNGRFSPSPLVSRKMTWSSPHGVQVLLSPEHGFFLWTPVAAIALVGLLMMVISAARLPGDDRPLPDRRQLASCLLVMFVATVYVTGSVESWTAAGAFGQRRFVNLTPLLTVGLAVLFARYGRTRTPYAYGLLLAAAVCVWWNLALIAQFGAHMMNRQRLELPRNAHTAFVTLPAMGPRLLYRYLFDRQSFYQPESTTFPR